MNEEEVSNELNLLRKRSHEQGNTLTSHELRVTLLETSVKDILNERLDRLEKNIDSWRDKHDADAKIRHDEIVKRFDSLSCAKGDICPIGKERINSIGTHIEWLWRVTSILVVGIVGLALRTLAK